MSDPPCVAVVWGVDVEENVHRCYVSWWICRLWMRDVGSAAQYFGRVKIACLWCLLVSSHLISFHSFRWNPALWTIGYNILTGGEQEKSTESDGSAASKGGLSRLTGILGGLKNALNPPIYGVSALQCSLQPWRLSTGESCSVAGLRRSYWVVYTVQHTCLV